MEYEALCLPICTVARVRAPTRTRPRRSRAVTVIVSDWPGCRTRAQDLAGPELHHGRESFCDRTRDCPAGAGRPQAHLHATAPRISAGVSGYTRAAAESSFSDTKASRISFAIRTDSSRRYRRA